TTSAANSPARMLICRAMVGLPAVAAPGAPNRGPDRLSHARQVSPPFGKAKSDLRKVPCVKADTEFRQGTCRVRARAKPFNSAAPLIPDKFTGSLRSLGSISWSLFVELLNGVIPLTHVLHQELAPNLRL